MQVQGHIEQQEYVDKDGNKRTAQSVIIGAYSGELNILDDKKKSEPAAPEPQERQLTIQQKIARNVAKNAQDVIEDDIPF